MSGRTRAQRAVAGLGLLALVLAGCSRAEAVAEPAAVTRPNPVAGQRLWVDPQSPAREQADAWRKENRLIDATRLEAIAGQPVATWLTGGEQDPYGTVRAVSRAARAAGRLPVFTLYNVPGRDCGLYSSGGAADVDAYLAWVGSVAAGLGDDPAIFVVEPDGIAHALSGCLGDPGDPRLDERLRALSSAVDVLERQPRAVTYLDAGNASWVHDLAALGTALRTAGLGHSDGFALNVANFEPTQATVTYGQRLSALVDGAHFVIDTSRNGAGAPPASQAEREAGHQTWCNPPTARLGAPPTTSTGVAGLDARLWVKQPGDSDGPCRPGAPFAGRWWPRYALQLAD